MAESVPCEGDGDPELERLTKEAREFRAKSERIIERMAEVDRKIAAMDAAR
jgi:hypothetical protein